LKYINISFVLLLLSAFSSVRADSPVVAVFGFCGTTRNQTVVANAFTSVLTQSLAVSDKFEVMKAGAVVKAIDERGGISALADEKVVEVLAHEMACQYVVFGDVLNADVDSVKFSGYGVTSFKTTFNLRVSLKVLNVYNKAIVFAKILETSSAPQVNIDTSPGFSAGVFTNLSKDVSKSVSAPMLTALLKDIRKDQLAQQRELQAQEVPSRSRMNGVGIDQFIIGFDCNVTDASVEIDGVLEGTCSDKIPVPAGVHEIVISARNYVSSRIKIRVNRDTVVPVDLIRPNRN
jgi:hypothetical protein